MTIASTSLCTKSGYVSIFLQFYITNVLIYIYIFLSRFSYFKKTSSPSASSPPPIRMCVHYSYKIYFIHQSPRIARECKNDLFVVVVVCRLFERQSIMYDLQGFSNTSTLSFTVSLDYQLLLRVEYTFSTVWRVWNLKSRSVYIKTSDAQRSVFVHI